MDDVQVPAWRVHDSGLVALPSRFRRLGGRVRHLQGHGEPWPEAVSLRLSDGHLHVTAPGGSLGSWPLAEVSVVRLATGPPVTFSLEVPGATHMLAAASTPSTEALLGALSH